MRGLNVHDILRHEYLIFLRSSLENGKEIASMREAHQIIKSLITEKSNRQKEEANQIGSWSIQGDQNRNPPAVEKLFR